MMLDGIDVSNNQGAINWGQVAQSGQVQFAFMKVSESTTFADPYARGWWQQTEANGILRGGYHFAMPADNDPESEAGFFMGCARNAGWQPGDVLALDIERYQGNLDGVDVGSWCLRFLDYVYGVMGMRPMIYCSSSLISEHGLAGYPRLGEYGLWLASWGLSHMPAAPAPWEFVACWQFSDNSHVPGIQGPVDGDVFNGDAAAWGRYGTPEGHAPVPPPPTEDPCAKLRYDLSVALDAVDAALANVRHIVG